METPDITTYAVETIEDELGSGVRIYDSGDRIYEARDHGAFESRLYMDDGAWEAAIRIPEEPQDAVDYLEQFGDRIEETYDLAFVPPLSDIKTEANDGLFMTRRADGFEIGYTTHDVDMDAIEAELPRTDSNIPMWTGYCIGFSVGNTVAPGAGGIAGGVIGGLGVSLLVDGGPFAAEALINRRRQSKYADIDILDDEDHFERVGELNELEQRERKGRLFRTEDHFQRLDTLREDQVRAKHELRMDLHFDRFTDREGGFLEASGETYDEAAAVLATVLDRDLDAKERPSIYDDLDVFRTVFEQLDWEGKKTLARNTIEREDDVAPAIDNYLDTSYDRLVEEAGRTTFTGVDDDGPA